MFYAKAAGKVGKSRRPTAILYFALDGKSTSLLQVARHPDWQTLSPGQEKKKETEGESCEWKKKYF